MYHGGSEFYLDVNKIEDRFGDPIEARDVIEWNSSIFSAI